MGTLVDVAVNITDPLFHGFDHKGRPVHQDDFEAMMDRAKAAGVTHMIITGTSYRQSQEAIKLCRKYPDRLRCTVGVHPANCMEFEEDEEKTWEKEKYHVYATNSVSKASSNLKVAALSSSSSTSMASQTRAEVHIEKLVRLIEENRDVVVAVGEIGLDFAELSCCPREVQQLYFAKQLEAFYPLRLPFLFHSRDCGLLFVETLKKFLSPTIPPASSSIGVSSGKDLATPQHHQRSIQGVVHSFTGTPEEQKLLLDSGLYLSLNGSAFREEAQALRLCHSIPLEKLFLETDAPWCDIRKSHYGNTFIHTRPETTPRGKTFVMGKCVERRTEPCHLVQVLEAFLGVANVARTGAPLTEEVLRDALHQNCLSLFKWDSSL